MVIWSICPVGMIGRILGRTNQAVACVSQLLERTAGGRYWRDLLMTSKSAVERLRLAILDLSSGIPRGVVGSKASHACGSVVLSDDSPNRRPPCRISPADRVVWV